LRSAGGSVRLAMVERMRAGLGNADVLPEVSTTEIYISRY
jgi:hypothetical protein